MRGFCNAVCIPSLCRAFTALRTGSGLPGLLCLLHALPPCSLVPQRHCALEISDHPDTGVPSGHKQQLPPIRIRGQRSTRPRLTQPLGPCPLLVRPPSHQQKHMSPHPPRARSHPSPGPGMAPPLLRPGNQRWKHRPTQTGR